MNNAGFNGIVEKRLTAIKETLNRKGDEYSDGMDRLSNFKTAGRYLDETPEESLLGMQAKHIVSILDMVDSINTGKEFDFTEDYIDEKIGDAINYFILLEGLLKERLYETN